MPLTKTPKGWMWGSKGPFNTKAKALQVARAAYASGYKSEQSVFGSANSLEASEKNCQQNLTKKPNEHRN